MSDDVKKYAIGEFIEYKGTRVIVGVDNLLEEANLIIEQGNTSVTLTVFVSDSKLTFRLKDYKNVKVDDTDEHPGRHTCILRNSALEGVQFYRNPTNDEVATEEWINYSFETIWKRGKASTQFWIGDIWVGVKNINGIEVFMTVEGDK